MQGPNRRYIPEVDELRGLAVVLVFFYHSLYQGYAAIGGRGWLTSKSPLAALLYEGHTAISLAMVLSGFILAKGTFEQPINYRRFITNRLLRIVPLTLFVMVFAVCASQNYTLEGILAPILLLANAPFRFNDLTQLTGTLWVVSVEFQFYLIAPFLLVFVARRGFLGYVLPVLVLILGVRLIAFYPSFNTPQELVRINEFTIIGRLNQFMFGIALAFVVDRSAVELKGVRAWALLVASAVAVLALAYALNSGGGNPVWHPWRLGQPELEGLAWAGVIAGYTFSRPFRWWPAQRGLMTLGVWSFSLYVLHWPLVLMFWGLYRQYTPSLLSGKPAILAVSAFILLPSVTVLSALSYFCVEKPFLDMRMRYLPGAVIQSPEPLPEMPKDRDSPLVLGALVGATALAAWLLWTAASPWLNVLSGDICQKETGHALALHGPFAREGTFGFTVVLPADSGRSDDMANPTRSMAVLCENQKSLGPAHSLHDDIRLQGGGRYSDWSGTLYFSTSDNSDPATNGRTYKLIVR